MFEFNFCFHILRYNFRRMLENFARLLSEECNLDFTRPIVVGLSGGADSQCLLDLLHHAGINLTAAHFNHNLRPESTNDALEVEKLAVAFNVPFFVGSEDVNSFSKDSGLSIEEAARIKRYEFLFSVAEKIGAQAVAVGHHADDQVETVLMHFLRGSGLAGLQGMDIWQIPNVWSKKIVLFRPLLGYWREEIDAYCVGHDLKPIEDKTNQEVLFWRNRLRLELIPFLETYNPKIKQVIHRMSRIIKGDYQWLEEQVINALDDCQEVSGIGYVTLNADQLNSLPLSIQRMLIRRVIEQIRKNLRDINFAMVEKVIVALKAPPATRQLDIGVGIRLFWEERQVWFAAWEAELPTMKWPQISLGSEMVHKLPVPGILDLGKGWVIESNLPTSVRLQEQSFENNDPYQAWLEFPSGKDVLDVRVRRPGDRFKPFGLKGHSQKLADYMINVKMPARGRAGWPLVCIGEDIVWLPGYTISNEYSLSEKIGRVVHLRLYNRENQSSSSD